MIVFDIIYTRLSFGFVFLHRYLEKKTRLSQRQVLQPHTETIVYNRLVNKDEEYLLIMKNIRFVYVEYTAYASLSQYIQSFERIHRW